MKKILSLLAILLEVVVQANAQTFYRYYINSTTPKKNKYEVSYMNGTADGKTRILIQAHGKAQKEYLMLDFKNLEGFRKGIINMRDKYIEWCNVAKTNKITSLEKEMLSPFDIDFGNAVGATWLYGGKWWFANGYSYFFTRPKFVISGTKKTMTYYLFCHASDNKYIENVVYITFSSVADFNSLINAINPKDIEAVICDNNKTEELFKD